MLTADLVDARRKDGELVLRALDSGARAEARHVAAELLELAASHVGRRREELEEAWESVAADVSPRSFKLAQGLKKLAADACSFEADDGVEPVQVRQVLFTRASEARRAASEGEPFPRAAVLEDAARSLGIGPDDVERALFSDLKSEHVLRAAPTASAAHLVEAWELGQAQAVLLAAVRVTCEIADGSPGLVRAFFAKLKFHQLLVSAERIGEGGGWRVVLDGPYSMFDAVTKYGLRLALVLPALRALERWRLVADVRWGKNKEPLVFRLESDAAAAEAGSDELHLSDEVRELAEAINAQKNFGWRARPALAVLDVPGHGVCIPDLELTRQTKSKSKSNRAPVYVEVLGYWSREAVFRRVELAERGLDAPIVFAVSSRLRVSAEVLADDLPSALYVYKGKISPRALLAHAELVSEKAKASRSGARARASRARDRAR